MMPAARWRTELNTLALMVPEAESSPDAPSRATAAPRAPSPPTAAPVHVRPLLPDDSIAELTALLHRAYRPQVEMGLRPLAGRQDEATTRARVQSGENFLAVAGPGALTPDGRAIERGRLLGTILFQEVESASFPPRFLKPGVGHFSLFAVDPEAQGMGVGRALLGRVEQRARELELRELALSMAEPDRGLFEFYQRRGYSLVEHWQWPYTNYRSLILSKLLMR